MSEFLLLNISCWFKRAIFITVFSVDKFVLRKANCKPPYGSRNVRLQKYSANITSRGWPLPQPAQAIWTLQTPHQKKSSLSPGGSCFIWGLQQRPEYATLWKTYVPPQDENFLAQHTAFKEVQPHYSAIASRKTAYVFAIFFVFWRLEFPF